MYTIEDYKRLVSELEGQIKSLRSQKKFGLIWEEQKEDIINYKNETIPLLISESSKSILTDANKPINLVIEGDNYDSLKALLFSHKEAIDIIYIDPPYNTGNTGNKDFTFNGVAIDKEDNYRQSKWLSFMKKRLQLAHKLLNDKGVIFISIDDNELYHLKLLMDDIFGQENFLFNMPRQSKRSNSGKHAVSTVTLMHEYVLCYKKNELPVFSKKEKDEETRSQTYKLSDEYVNERGRHTIGQLNTNSLGYVPSLDYPIISPDNTPIYPDGKGDSNNKVWRWTWSKAKLEWGIENGYVVFKKQKGDWKVYIKSYEFVDSSGNERLPENPYSSLEFIDTKLTNFSASTELSNIFSGQKVFQFPKLTSFIKEIIKLVDNPNATILDFFAGSGTTGHAVLELNREYGGNRKFILCSNNEDQVCENVTYERNRRIIQGYENSKGKSVVGLGGNLKYMKVQNENTSELDDLQKERIRDLSEQMLILKENTHYKIHSEEGFSLYSNPQGEITGILYDAKFFVEFIEKLQEHPQQDKSLYLFAWSNDTYEELVQEISYELERVTFNSIPNNIISFYKNNKEVL